MIINLKKHEQNHGCTDAAFCRELEFNASFHKQNGRMKELRFRQPNFKDNQLNNGTHFKKDKSGNYWCWRCRINNRLYLVNKGKNG